MSWVGIKNRLKSVKRDDATVTGEMWILTMISCRNISDSKNSAHVVDELSERFELT